MQQMATKMQVLDPLRLPLQGQILIEASAGTGKTYTIGLLFLRLLLERKLSVDEILVVTFTKAATEELRGRIRLRIREALDALEPGVEPCSSDPLLQSLIDGVSNREQATILLSDALQRMDEAMISTIHGFCQRMLQLYAFESGAPFEMEFIETESVLRQQIIEDFWREHFYDLNQDQATRIRSFWATPEALLKSLGARPGDPAVICIPEVDAAQAEETQSRLDAAYAKLVRLWPACREAVLEQLSSNQRLSRADSNAYSLRRLDIASCAMEELIVRGHSDGLWAPEIDLFTRSKIEASLKASKKHDPPEHAYFDAFDRVYALYQEVIARQKNALLQAARSYLAAQLLQRKQQRAQMYFDDLLNGMDTALQGPKGKHFASQICTRFPAILVDEFQDTDHLQYRIFATLYRAVTDNPTPQPGLFLIGDPKQAIYAFRGADIFTYLQARDDTAQQNRFTMDRNYRSTPAMVGAVNQLFKQARPFIFDNISYPPVSAAGKAAETPLSLNGEVLSAMHCLLLTDQQQQKPLNIGDAKTHAVTRCAAQVSELLLAGLQKNARIGDQALAAGDIAILVRTHDEAELIREALQGLHVASVYLGRKSIFESAEAAQLCQLLETLENLSHEGRVRTALASPFFGYRATQLEQLFKDEQQWVKILSEMARYRRLIQERGFALFFETLMAEQQMVKRLYAQTDGERSLTNFLHLAELLQASTSDTDLPALLRWLNAQIESPGDNIDAQQLRLESDENLVKIVTIHAAKGLEYAVVFLPFLWSARPCKKNEPLSFHFPEHPSQLVIDLGSGEQAHYDLAEKERLAEDLRLLYVAITRARYACYFCWGNIKGMELSALYYLLHPQPPVDDKQLREALSTLSTPHSILCIHDPGDESPAPLEQADSHPQRLSVKAFDGRIDRRWRINSYSGLTAHRAPATEQPDYDLPTNRSAHTQASAFSAFGFPRGAEAGICLHAVMEHISFSDPQTHPAVIEAQLTRAAYSEKWAPVLTQWLPAILNTPLAAGLKLCELGDAQRVDEMAFYFPLRAVDATAMNGILAQHGYPPLPEHNHLLHGLMIGFIDLVFEHQGQYFIADYKSNHLGDQPSDYQPARLQAAIDEHRYDLQYLIYSVALHRYLSTRISAYRYEQHFGGAYYLFLRGMHPDYASGNGVFFARPPALLIEQLDHLFDAGERKHA